MKLWKKLLCLATAGSLLLGISACSSEDINTALDLADSILASAQEEDEDTSPVYDDSQAEESSEDDSSSDSTSSQGSGYVEAENPYTAETFDADTLDEDGTYSSKEDVALYIYTYNHLPSNYITKKEAEALGWTGGSLEPYAPGKCIGGSYFGNYEGVLPEGHEYHECDIDTLGASKRGAKRIVYSDDGLIYYTEDHYETFTLLYGEE
jgi:cobalamin biosynthesis protein CobT